MVLLIIVFSLFYFFIYNFFFFINFYYFNFIVCWLQELRYKHCHTRQAEVGRGYCSFTVHVYVCVSGGSDDDMGGYH